MKKKGFTLAELLVVVGIIAVLVAIAIPVFTAQLEKAREATDLANIRAAYAEVMVDAVMDPTQDDLSKDVNLTQAEDGWGGITDAATTLGKLGTVSGSPSAGGTCTVAWDVDTSKATFTFAAAETE